MLLSIACAVALSQQRMHRHHAHHVATKAKPVDETIAIRKQVHKVEQAFDTKNYTLFRSVLTSNFQQELPNHKVLSLREAVATLRQYLTPLSDISANINLQEIKVDGSTATINDNYSMKAKMTDKKGKHNVVILGSETVSAKKVRGQWLAYYEKGHDQSMSVDGHIVMHMP